MKLKIQCSLFIMLVLIPQIRLRYSKTALSQTHRGTFNIKVMGKSISVRAMVPTMLYQKLPCNEGALYMYVYMQGWDFSI